MATIAKANEMALTEAQKRAQQSPWNKRGVKGPKAEHGSNQVLLQSRNHAGLSAPERMRRA
jgi:hypothetical protein